jgi:hypothetical protein
MSQRATTSCLIICRIGAVKRGKVEYPFRIIKRQFGHVKTPYSGLAMNHAQLFTLFALGNLCSRSATCSWNDGGQWHKEESAQNPPNRRDGGGEATRLVPFARTQPHRNDQTNKSAQAKRLIRRSLRFRPLALGVTHQARLRQSKLGKYGISGKPPP